MKQSPTFRLAKIVRFHRKKAKLTQAKLAQLAGIGKTAVFDIEKGKASIQVSTLLAVLHVLNIQLNPQSPLMHLFNKAEDEKS